MTRILILRYGSGNLTSILHAFSNAGHPVTITEDRPDILQGDVLILPGVGNACSALASLHDKGHIEVLNERFKIGRLTIGICLGAQLMCEYLEEADDSGLGWIHGSVTKIGKDDDFNNGWSRVDMNGVKRLGLSRGISERRGFYFNHKYKLPDSDEMSSIIMSHGSYEVPAVVQKGSAIGIQFHPEKSQINGVRLIRNLLEDYHGV